VPPTRTKPTPGLTEASELKSVGLSHSAAQTRTRGPAKMSTMVVYEFPGWTDEPRSLHAPTMLIFGDRDFSPLADVVEMF
jgi:hypothetical protein